MMWKIVVDFPVNAQSHHKWLLIYHGFESNRIAFREPVPGGPWITSRFWFSRRIISRCLALLGTAHEKSRESKGKGCRSAGLATALRI